MHKGPMESDEVGEDEGSQIQSKKEKREDEPDWTGRGDRKREANWVLEKTNRTDGGRGNQNMGSEPMF
ncbi:hypothetical protein RHMOL_Rhmol10G0220200 [Rhododendron molle]|uniref:Uncharacterized protein n=1 Tax=Rhododendron molle TaxID=49168 RepID=A0ACC0M6N3_RHOML|nr:hypothetical protein RHMOL_Rhmol10G0220200 [Rhododendron molle]